MKRVFCCLFILVFLTSTAYAESFPAATSSPSRTYTFDDYYNLIIQEGDLDPENICQTIWAMMEWAIGEEDKLQEVSLENGVLTIKVDLSDTEISEYYTRGMYAQDRTSSIMDSIFSYSELDEYWESIHIVYQYAEATFTPDMAKGTGDRRYIDDPDIKAQIPD